MSSNLVGGFFQRLDRARKYAFGSVCILGEDKNNCIAGIFIFRGDSVPFEVTDAADYDSYSFTKIDTSVETQKRMVDSFFAWDDLIDGKKFADGKIFK
jgi:elongation factor 1-gamma